jgi:hypothetical protein
MARKNEHKPVWGKSFVTGYLKGTGHRAELTGWKGESTGWKLYDKDQTHTNEHGDKSFAVILVKQIGKRTTKERYAVGYYLGDGGDLVRAETAPEWTEGKMDSGEFSVDDLWQWAKDVADYWFEKDQEDAEKFDQEQREAEEEEMSG